MRKAETLTKMPTTKQQQLLACAIVDFLQQSSTDGTVSADDAESVGGTQIFRRSVFDTCKLVKYFLIIHYLNTIPLFS
jgi:hypothetical protein